MSNKRTRDDSVSSTPDDASPEARLASRSPSVEAAAHTPKYASLDTNEPTVPKMRCLLPPHKALSFATYDDYETHYQQAHTNRCIECKKNLPTSHFLELHIAENHDPIVAAKRDKGDKTYACFVEVCDKVCGEWTKRRSHLVDKHGFPRNYDFFVVNNGVDGRRSMLRAGVDAHGHRRSSRERRGSSATETTQDTEATSVSDKTSGEGEEVPVSQKAEGKGEPGKTESQSKVTTAVDELTSTMSAMKMVPRSVTFGRRGGRAGFAKS
ncbi:hypothetical protein LTR36_003444 [Oleoguttula mirabilis]|uniref:C2H2-type domain-containing protein n=1 Tax=Oleoguttula mirabilis TaxID=1507867 RepID=A0AAV9JIM0_9PEZI|nr:hypothetical protein LTR36_003444 [Oleoguttula mirabilis]